MLSVRLSPSSDQNPPTLRERPVSFKTFFVLSRKSW